MELELKHDVLEELLGWVRHEPPAWSEARDDLHEASGTDGRHLVSHRKELHILRQLVHHSEAVPLYVLQMTEYPSCLTLALVLEGLEPRESLMIHLQHEVSVDEIVPPDLQFHNYRQAFLP